WTADSAQFSFSGRARRTTIHEPLVEILERRRLLSSVHLQLPPGAAAADLMPTSFTVSGLPATVYAGRHGTAVIRVSNTGNTIALGEVPHTLFAASAATPTDLSGATAVANFTRRLRIKPGSSELIRARF